MSWSKVEGVVDGGWFLVRGVQELQEMLPSLLVDTNVVSELRRPNPHKVVLNWIAAAPTDQLFLSAVMVGEIQAGIEMGLIRNVSQNYFVSPDAKERILLEFTKQRNKSVPKGDLGGRKFPDPGILRLCDWLNGFDGICPLQSCAGHQAPDSRVISKEVL